MHLHARLVVISALSSIVLTACATPVAAKVDPTKPVVKINAAQDEAPFILVGAGDISTCENDNDEATAKVVEASLAASKEAAVFTAGDNAYRSGTVEEFEKCYGPTWGRFKDRTHPVAGNHEYLTPDAAGYFAYFGQRAGKPGEGYYSTEAGSWHVVVLNSNCTKMDCKKQAEWLAQDLKAHPSTCTVALWHHPRFSSGEHGSDDSMTPFWKILQDASVDLVIAGHDHHYERFAPLTHDGVIDDKVGIRSFIVGTGGKSHYPVKAERVVGSEMSNTGTDGVLELQLFNKSYRWRFLATAGGTFTDVGDANCR